MPEQLTPGQTAYNAYGATTDHLNYQGLPMPAWADLGDTIRQAWENAAAAVRDQVLSEGDALIRGRCPVHSDAPATYMNCHCVAADQLLAARLNREA